MTGEQKPGGLEVVAWRWQYRLNPEWRLQLGPFILPRCGPPLSDYTVEPLTPAEPAEARIRELEVVAALVEARATAAEAKLARAVEGLGVITDLSVNLRRGGPDSSDLNDLSDALDTAVSVAAEVLDALQQGTEDQ